MSARVVSANRWACVPAPGPDGDRAALEPEGDLLLAWCPDCRRDTGWETVCLGAGMCSRCGRIERVVRMTAPRHEGTRG